MKIIIAGDFCPGNRVNRLIEATCYDTVLSEVKPLLESADYSLVNLECPVVLSPSVKAIDKIGPNLKTGRKAIDLIKYAGFSGVTLANNHIRDYGSEGIEDTLFVCADLGLDTVGVGMNDKEASKVLYKNIAQKRVGFINCCEREFSIATEKAAGANPISPIRQYYAIREARVNSDYVVVIVHGGHEYFQYPSPRMKELYRFYIDAGADVVVNHHQHCVCGYEQYNGKPIFYGLGNFCFDAPSQRNTAWNEGYMVELSFTENIDFRLIPYTQCNDIPAVSLMEGDKRNEFFQRMMRLNTIISDDDRLREVHQNWMQRNLKEAELAFAPCQNRIFRYLFYKGFISNLLTKRKRLRLIDYIECEAHRDRTLEMLKRKKK